MSLKKCRALIRRLFLGPRLLKRTLQPFVQLGCIAASTFKRTGRCHAVSSFKRTGFWLPHVSTAAVCSAFCQKKSRNHGCDSIIHLQARANAAQRWSKKRFESAFRRISANH